MEALGQWLVQSVPALVFLVAGFVLVVIEMYIPGFGAPGIVGSVLLVAGIVLGSHNAMEALVIAVVMIALLCIALSITIHSASKGRLSRSWMVLREVSTPPLTQSDLDYFVGRTGVTRTVLRPAGIGEFDGVKLNVVSDGEFIPAGARVRVLRVEGNRIVVCAEE